MCTPADTRIYNRIQPIDRAPVARSILACKREEVRSWRRSLANGLTSRSW